MEDWVRLASHSVSLPRFAGRAVLTGENLTHYHEFWAVKTARTALDEIRTSMAARHLEGRIMNARMLAVKRSASVALRFAAVNGREVHSAVVQRSAATLMKWAAHDQDRTML